ncbi:ribosome biogenesis protein SLX9 homolog isoform X2 [Scyliorhinus torazame]|uniref:ribosome biogenesis protein SLX9 homolog isoform X2 n=1 Tax=Scyliorhinus torazame TaxID=75743 RepID=UPI003B59EC76
MVGKERRVRHKLHSAAVKLSDEVRTASKPALVWPPPPGADWKTVRRDADQLSTSLFAGTIIDPKALVRNLDVDCKTVVSSKKGNKLQLTKKEKLKQRHDRWLQKIELIKLVERKKKAQKKRRATPVVGDMQPLADALPELTDLLSASNVSVANKSKSLKKKPGAVHYSKMRHAQKRKLIEDEVARFKATIYNAAFKANPLALVGEQLLKRMRQEDEDLK